MLMVPSQGVSAEQSVASPGVDLMSFPVHTMHESSASVVTGFADWNDRESNKGTMLLIARKGLLHLNQNNSTLVFIQLVQKRITTLKDSVVEVKYIMENSGWPICCFCGALDLWKIQLEIYSYLPQPVCPALASLETPSHGVSPLQSDASPGDDLIVLPGHSVQVVVPLP